MVGKASLLLVLGFSLIFLVFGERFVSLSGQATDNMVNYYSDAIAHECASAGANMATTEFFRDQSWSAGFNNIDFNGGKINVTIQRSANIVITSVGTYRGVSHTDVVTFRGASFSRFAYFSTMENDGPGSPPIWWTPNDTVWGPFHTQDYMYVYNHPVFLGPVSTAKNLVYYNYYQSYPTQIPQNPTNGTQRRAYNNSIASDAPVFKGGFDPGTNNPMPMDGLGPIKTAAQSDGFYIPQTTTTTTYTDRWGRTITTTTTDTAYITFNNNKVIVKMGYSKAETTYDLSTIAPNGVIYINGMDVRLKGTLGGQYTVAGEGNIYLDDDIVYKSDPLQHSNSTDLLGIVAQNSVLITNNSANNDDGINIDAAIYCQTGGFGAEDYDTRPFSHYINLLGGITQYKRQPVGTFGGHTNTGFYKRYRYDQRLWDKLAPPFYPHTEKPTILSWLEE